MTEPQSSEKNMGLPAAGAGEKAILDASAKVAGFGLKRLQKWFNSYDLLILGQERAGKSSFYNFLRYNLFAIDGQQTDPTVLAVNSGVFTFEWPLSTGGRLTLELRNAGDRSGQLGPYAHAQMFVRRKPHLLVVVLDVTKGLDTDTLHGSYGNWFNWFSRYVAENLMNHPSRAQRINKRLCTMVVLLNKIDLLELATRDEVISMAKKNIRESLSRWLSPYLGGRAENFPVIPCFMVRDPRNFGVLEDTKGHLQLIVEQLVRSAR